MDIVLGPWKAEMSVEESLRKPLADAMGDEAFKTVKKAPDFTPKVAVANQPDPGDGFIISGKVKSVVKAGRQTHVFLEFTVWFSNAKALSGDAFAEGSMTAEDATRAITEDRINKLLKAIKAGTIQKAR